MLQDRPADEEPAAMTEPEALLAPDALVRDGRVQVSTGGGVALIRLNRPDKMNAFDAEQIEAFEHALGWFESSGDVHAGVLTGSERAFCAGGDITTFDAIDVERGFPYTRRGYDILRPLERGEKPLIAAVDGCCLAGGLEVALACDFIIAGQNARFGFGELDLGLIPAWGGTVRLTRAIPARMARQMILTSQRIGAERAADLGLVNEVVPGGGTVKRALELALAIAAQPPIAVRVAKLAAHLAADGAGVEAALAAERVGGALLFGTSDVHRAVRAWTQKARGSA
jgi:enoyl-CoA hydratase/carnithine racemase